jgi:hypothetical protein
LEGILSRGDEKAGRLVHEAYRRGARLDAWEEHVRLDLWRQVIEEANWDVLGETCRSRTQQERLPWDTVSLTLSKSEISDRGNCFRSSDSHKPRVSMSRACSGGWKRLLFTFSKKGAAVFISHLDLMVVFERAVARAGYSARFTEGFNPKPRLEFANPLSLGLTSEQEVAGIDLHDFDSADSYTARVNDNLPHGLRVLRAAPVVAAGMARRRSLMSLYWGADFELRDEDGRSAVIRLPASGPSIKKTLQATGRWQTCMITRISTWAEGQGQQPVSYFEALCAPFGGTSEPLEADSALLI